MSVSGELCGIEMIHVSVESSRREVVDQQSQGEGLTSVLHTRDSSLLAPPSVVHTPSLFT